MRGVHLGCVVAVAAACTTEAPDDRLGFSLAEVHQVTHNFVTGCVLEHSWAEQFADEWGRPPVIRIRGLTNATGEDLDTSAMKKLVAEELARTGRVVVAPANKKADFLLTGRLAFESDTNPDALLGRGHRRYIGKLSVVSTRDGRSVCSATGAIIRWIDG